jgi:hypothetical protein
MGERWVEIPRYIIIYYSLDLIPFGKLQIRFMLLTITLRWLTLELWVHYLVQWVTANKAYIASQWGWDLESPAITFQRFSRLHA